MVTGWGRMGGKVRAGGREWMRRGRISCWSGDQWVLAQEKESEGGESGDERMMIVKLIVQKKRKKIIGIKIKI
jgi:hypothetical protein